jgi:hypothetical protein
MMTQDSSLTPRDADIPELLEALTQLLLVCGSTGDYFADFEEQAEAFRRETGYMRPGKDVPAAYGGDDRAELEARHKKYREWVDDKIALARAVAKSAREADTRGEANQ